MKKFPKSKATGKLGVSYVERIVFGAGSIFREVPEDTDLGIDGYIEFVENEVAIGLLVAVQIKAGSSYLVQYSDGKYFAIGVTNRDLRYWNIQPIPVTLITYDPETELSGWLDVTGYIRNHPECLQQEHTTLTIYGQGKPFNIDSFNGQFRGAFAQYRSESNIFDYADLMASSDPEEKYRGFLGLISNPKSRFSKLTCFMLIAHLFHDHNGLRSGVSDALSRYLPHPEVGFVPPLEIRSYVTSALQKMGKSDVIRLLETAWLDEENLMQRGSLGQSVGVIITCIPNHELYLCEIAVDKSESYKTRWAAIALAAEFELEPVIRYVAWNYDRVDWGEAKEAAKWAAEEVRLLDGAETDLLELVAKQGYDVDDLADMLREASLPFLVENEIIVTRIFNNTKNSPVRLEASRALERIIRNRFPPEEYMQKLL